MVRGRPADLPPAGRRAGPRAGRLGHSRAGRRALPHRARPRRGRVRSDVAEAQARDRPRRRHAAGPRRRRRPRHPLAPAARRTCRASSARAGTSPGPGATCGASPSRWSRRTWWRPCASRPAPATAGSSSWGTGSTATPATSPPASRPRTLKDAVQAAHDEGARVTAHCFAEDTLDDMLDAGIDCIEHATGPAAAAPAAVRRTGRADRAHPDQHRHVPGHRRPGRGQVPPLRGAHARALGAPGRTGPGSLRSRRHASTPERTPAASSGTAGSWTRSRRCTPPDSRPRPPSTPAPGPRGTGCGADGITEGASADVLVCAEDPRGNLATLRDLRHIVLRGQLVRWEPARSIRNKLKLQVI